MRLGVSLGLTAALIVCMILTGVGLMDQRTLDYITVLSIGWAVFGVLEGRGRLEALLIAAATVAALFVIRRSVSGIVYMPYLLILPANLGMAWLFARGLRAGRIPILQQLIQIMNLRPVDDPAFRRFIRRQCLLWSCLSLATAVTAFVAMLWVSAHPWIGDVLTTVIVAQVVWFPLSHAYAARRYQRPETWWRTARTMTRSEVWAALRAS